MRQAGDVAGTRKAVTDIMQLCFEAGVWRTLDDQIVLISKRRGQLKQALIALKKGTQLIKYSRKGKPKFCTFRLSPDETTLIWYSHGAERHLTLSSVKRIIPGQRTFCKDKVESEVRLAGLKALISTGQTHSRRTRSEIYDYFGGSNASFPQIKIDKLRDMWIEYVNEHKQVADEELDDAMNGIG